MPALLWVVLGIAGIMIGGPPQERATPGLAPEAHGPRKNDNKKDNKRATDVHALTLPEGIMEQEKSMNRDAGIGILLNHDNVHVLGNFNSRGIYQGLPPMLREAEVNTTTAATRETCFSHTRTYMRPDQRPQTDINGLPLRAGTLSMNRVMWRSLLRMDTDADPGTEPRKIMGAPLNASQLRDVLQTTRSMEPDAKIAMLTGFLRFVLELAQQVCQTMIEGREVLSTEPTEAEDKEDSIMMQTASHKMRPEDAHRAQQIAKW